MHHQDPSDRLFILARLGLSERELHAQGLQVHDLVEIYQDYTPRLAELADIAALLANTMMREPHVHAARYRVKQPLHLLKKIIRKKEEYPHRHLTAQNYLQYINDLVGVRVLHLHKPEGLAIGNYIQQTWELKRMPYAYISNSQNPEAYLLAGRGYKLLVNPRGYTALHYIIRTQPNKQAYLAEIQTKTLFEEGWSELDHCLRYPDHEPHPLLEHLLRILNTHTRQANELVSRIHAIAGLLKQPHGNIQLKRHLHTLPLPPHQRQHLLDLYGRS